MRQMFLKLTLLGLILGSVQAAHALCVSEVQYDDEGNVVSALDGEGKPITGGTLAAIQQMYDQNPEHGASGSGMIEALRQAIVDIMLVDPTREIGEGTRMGDGQCSIDQGCDPEYNYLNNVDAVRENQNKMKVNAATRAVALGKRSVALATEAGGEVDALRAEIESRDDVLQMLKGVAKLQARHLQKTSTVTALRAKLMELNAIDDIISGDIYTKTMSTEETEEK